MDYLEDYIQTISQMPRKIFNSEKTNILSAAKLMANATQAGKFIHIFGTDAHSSIAGEEFFWRVGGLMNINPIFDPGFSLAHGAYRCWMIEQLPGYAASILNYYMLNSNDVIIIVNSYGINRVTIDAAIEAKNKGLTVIAITSKKLADSIPKQHSLRHPSKYSLYELKEVDIVIDGGIIEEDNIIKIPEMEQKMGPLSTIYNSIVLGMLNAVTVKMLYERGFEPDILKCMYENDGMKHNEKMIEKYNDIIKHL
jgi:uncharacterized phosphosugar-binding protein